MAEIIKKVDIEHFEKMLAGDKKFELRLADEEYNVGDILVLKEVDDKKEFTGRELKRKITHLLKTKNYDFWPAEDIEKYGFVLLSLK